VRSAIQRPNLAPTTPAQNIPTDTKLEFWHLSEFAENSVELTSAKNWKKENF
jgi:hypothetical protein